MKSFITFVFFYVCSVAPVFSQTTTPKDSTVQTVGTDSSQYATLYVYRPSNFSGAIMGFKIHLESADSTDRTLGYVSNGSKFKVKIYKAGTYNLWARTESTEEVPITIELGKSYYIKCRINMGVFVGRPGIDIVSEEQGKAGYAKIKKEKEPEPEDASEKETKKGKK